MLPVSRTAPGALPVSTAAPVKTRRHSLLALYLRRLLKPTQMDFQ